MRITPHSIYSLNHLREMKQPLTLSDASQEDLDKEAHAKKELSMEESRTIRERKAMKAEDAAEKAAGQTFAQPESLYKNAL